MIWRVHAAFSTLLISTGMAKEEIVRKQVWFSMADTARIIQCEIIDHYKAPHLERYIERLVEARKKKNLTPEGARDLLQDANYFGTVSPTQSVSAARTYFPSFIPGHHDGIPMSSAALPCHSFQDSGDIICYPYKKST